MPLWHHVPGGTPIDDLSGLKVKGITRRKELNEVEAENIRKAVVKYFAAPPTPKVAPFDLSWALRLHREMFGDVWKWAGAPQDDEPQHRGGLLPRRKPPSRAARKPEVLNGPAAPGTGGDAAPQGRRDPPLLERERPLGADAGQRLAGPPRQPADAVAGGHGGRREPDPGRVPCRRLSPRIICRARTTRIEKEVGGFRRAKGERSRKNPCGAMGRGL